MGLEQSAIIGTCNNRPYSGRLQQHLNGQVNLVTGDMQYEQADFLT